MSDVLKRKVTAVDIQRGSTQPEGLGGRRSLFMLARQGITLAQISLADLYYEGRGVPLNYFKAALWYLRAAKLGDRIAQRVLGYLYCVGEGVAQDYNEGMSWYRLAGEQGDAMAQLALASSYYHGKGVVQDYAEGVHWYQMLAEQHGDTLAQEKLADHFLFGTGAGGVPNYPEAMRWYRLAAKQGVIGAQYNLALGYFRGDGVPQDYAKAVRWYRLAAERGHVNAQYGLAVCYFTEKGVARDYAEALHWCRLAAERGSSEAQEMLRRFYNDQGDYAEAQRWQSIINGQETAPQAADTGDKDKAVDKIPSKVQNTEVRRPDFKTITAEDFLSDDTLFNRTCEFLAANDVAEQPRSTLASTIVTLIEVARRDRGDAIARLAPLAKLAETDPPLFATKIAAAEKVRSATPVKPHALTHQQRETVRRRREAGEPVAALADEFGVAPATISRAARGVSRGKAQH